MKLTFEVILGLLIAFVVYNVVHHFFVVIPSQKRLLKMKHPVDLALNASIKYFHNPILPIKSNVLSDIWGRGILVFEYVFNVNFKDNNDLKLFQKQLSEALSNYAQKKYRHQCFIITDLFQYDDNIHVDIAYLANKSTIEYVKDIDKL